MRSSASGLSCCLEPVVQGRRGLALGLWGEAGVGKSHALEGLRRAVPCPGFTVEAAALPGALAKALPRPGSLPGWVRHWAEHLEAGERFAPEDWAEALGEWLAGLAPVVVGLEGVHRAAPEVQAGVLDLARRAVCTPGVGLVVTGESPLPVPFSNRRLEPMGWDESRVFLQGLAGEALPLEALEWLYLRSAGNPLLLREYRRHLTAAGYLWHNGKFWRWREPPAGHFPTTLPELVRQAVGRALHTPLQQRALGARACLGEGPDEAVWAQVAGLSPQALRLARQGLEAVGLLEGADFPHPLYREACLELLDPAEREQYLREVPREPVEAPPAPTRRADARRRLEAVQRQAEALERAGDYRGLEPVLEEAVRAAPALGQGRAVAEARMRLAALHVELGKYAEAEAGLEAARDLLRRGGPHPLLARCRALLCRLHRERDLPEGRLPALRAARAALALARSLNDPAARVLCLGEAALGEAWAGQGPRALDLAREALEAAQSPAQRESAHGALALVLVHVGQLTAARGALYQALELAATPLARHRLGLELDRLTGGLELARPRLRELRQLGLHGLARRLERYFPELAVPAAAPALPPCSAGSCCLEVLGPVQLSGRPIAGVKRQELLLCLLEARLLGRSGAGPEELQAALYPHTEAGVARVLLEDLIDRTRTALGPVVVGTPQGWALGAVTSDAERFLQGGDTRLWRGVYRQDLPGGLPQARERLHSSLYQRACALLEHDPLEAARLGRLLLEAEPYDPRALTLRLRLLQATRQPNPEARDPALAGS